MASSYEQPWFAAQGQAWRPRWGGFVTVLVSKWLTGEADEEPAGEALHVLHSGVHLQTSRALLRRRMVASSDVRSRRGIVTSTQTGQVLSCGL